MRDSGLHLRVHVADVDEDLVVAAGRVRGRLRASALLPFEPVFAGIRARSWPWEMARPLEQRRTSGGKAGNSTFATPGDGAGSDTRNLRGVMLNSPPNSLDLLTLGPTENRPQL